MTTTGPRSTADFTSGDLRWTIRFLKTIKSPEDGSGRSNYSPLLDYKYQRIQMREEERKKSPKPNARRPSPWNSKITPCDSYFYPYFGRIYVFIYRSL